MMKKYKEWLKEEVDVLTYHKQLDPTIWENEKLDPKIRKKLLKIAEDFFNSIELETEIINIYFMGSMAGFNYTELSDLDTHIVIDFENIGPKDLVKKAVDGNRFEWNVRHHISMRGHDVELYVQDKDEEVVSSGVYSLMDDKWIQKPKYNPPKLTDKDIDPKYKAYVFEIDELEKTAKSDIDIEEIEKYYVRSKEIKKKLSEARKLGIKENGEFSIENLVFKKLRNEGYVGKLIDIKNQLYDKMFAQ